MSLGRPGPTARKAVARAQGRFEPWCRLQAYMRARGLETQAQMAEVRPAPSCPAPHMPPLIPRTSTSARIGSRRL